MVSGEEKVHELGPDDVVEGEGDEDANEAAVLDQHLLVVNVIKLFFAGNKLKCLSLATRPAWCNILFVSNARKREHLKGDSLG